MPYWRLRSGTGCWPSSGAFPLACASKSPGQAVETDVEGWPYTSNTVLYKALEHLWTWVSTGSWTNLPQIPRDDSTSMLDSIQGCPVLTPLTQSSKETKGFLHLKVKVLWDPGFFCSIPCYIRTHAPRTPKTLHRHHSDPDEEISRLQQWMQILGARPLWCLWQSACCN